MFGHGFLIVNFDQIQFQNFFQKIKMKFRKSLKMELFPTRVHGQFQLMKKVKLLRIRQIRAPGQVKLLKKVSSEFFQFYRKKSSIGSMITIKSELTITSE
jgi:hypothetical protein